MEELNYKAGKATLNYARSANKSEALVLIPAQGTTWKSYEPVLKMLSRDFQVFAITIRGHGKSTWTTGNYNFNTVGNDLVLFLENVVKRPAILCGNSSGGLISLWLGVNYPHLVKKIILEDAPLFSADWPRIKNEFVYEVLEKTSRFLGKKNGPDYRGFFRSIEKPSPDGKTVTLPSLLGNFMAWLIQNNTSVMVKALTFMLPRRLRQMISDIPLYDPDFARAWVDGSFYEGLDHESALKRVKLPLLIIHADWYRTTKGLIGAMDDNDAMRAKALVPHAKYTRIHASHGVHVAIPDEFVRIVRNFALTNI